MKLELPENCTMCGGDFEYKGKKVAYPYPDKQILCFLCFNEAMDTGIGRLNKVLRGEALTEEDFKPHSRSSHTRRKEA